MAFRHNNPALRHNNVAQRHRSLDWRHRNPAYRHLSGVGSLWTPELFFAASEVGVAMLPGSPYGAMYQERTGAAATTPAVPDDPVGTYHCLLTDRYAVAPADDSRAIYRVAGGLHGLEFDGSNDSYSVAIDFSSTDAMSVFAATRKEGTAVAIVAELSTNAGSNNGTFFFGAPGAASNVDVWLARGSASQSDRRQNVAPFTGVYTAVADISAQQIDLDINGVAAGNVSGTNMGTGNFGNHTLYIGRRANSTLPFDGFLYGLIIRGALPVGDDRANGRAYMAGRAGVTLP